MPLGAETVRLAAALGRVLAADMAAEVDVPSFDRSNMDGYALCADDTYGASEESPRRLRLGGEEIPTGAVPRLVVEPGTASPIATGGMLPRGADAVLMVEHARVDGECLEVLHAVAPSANLSFAGADVARGELVLRRGTLLSARETGLLAAIGRADVPVLRRPRVAIVSTGAELIAPGSPPRPAAVYDANATLLADAVRELGCQPVPLGIVGDDQSALDDALERGLATADVVLLSGGTSKGGGDLSYRVLARRSPGIVVHGVALKPGKPICLGAAGSTSVAILPGFPTSAIFTFQEFVAPVLLQMAGLGPETHGEIEACTASGSICCWVSWPSGGLAPGRSGSDRREGWTRRPGASAISPGYTCWIRRATRTTRRFFPRAFVFFPVTAGCKVWCTAPTILCSLAARRPRRSTAPWREPLA